MKREKNDRCMMMDLPSEVLSLILKKAMQSEEDLTKEPISRSIESLIKSLTGSINYRNGLWALVPVQGYKGKKHHFQRFSDWVSYYGLPYLSVYTNLKSLNLRNCHDLRDEDLVYLMPSKTLTKINLTKKSMKYSVNDNICISAIQYKSFIGKQNITDKGIIHLSRFENLTSINLSKTKLGKNGPGVLSAFTKLTSLNLSHCSEIAKSLFPLSSLVNLTYLKLRNVYSIRNMYDKDDSDDYVPGIFCFLPHLTKLTFLDVSFNTMNSGSSVHFSTLTNLASLSFALVDTTDTLDDCLAGLPLLTRLTFLDLDGCRTMSDSALSSLSKFTNLTELRWYGYDGVHLTHTNDGLSHLSSCANLTNIKLGGHNDVTGDGIHYLSSLTKLTDLTLNWWGQITGDAFHHLSACSNLVTLCLWGSGLRDEVIESLSNLRSVTDLNLGTCKKLTDVGVKYISKLTNLTYLDLFGCKKLTVVGLLHLSACTKLRFPFYYGMKKIKESWFENFIEATNLDALPNVDDL